MFAQSCKQTTNPSQTRNIEISIMAMLTSEFYGADIGYKICFL